MTSQTSLPPGTAQVAAILLAVASLTVMANAAIAPSLPGLQEQFKDRDHIATLVGLVMTMPSLAIVLTAPFGGALADRIGRRPVMITALVAYGLAGASGFLAPTLETLIAGRILLGVAVGGTMTSALALIGDHFHGSARDLILRVQAAAMSGGAIVYVLVGGVLGGLGWRWPFLVYLFSFALLPLVVWRIHDIGRGPAPKQGPAASGRLPARVLFLVGAAALTAMMSFMLIPSRLPFFLVELKIPSPFATAVAVAVGNGAMVVTALRFASFAARLSPLAIYALIFALIACGLGVVGTAGGLVQALAGVLVVGLGLGLLFPNANGLVLSATPPALRGRATGVHTAAVFLGQFLSPIVSAPFVARFGTGGMFVAFAVILAAVAGGFALAALRGAPTPQRTA